MAQHSFPSLMRRLAAAGFKAQFARTALLPDWWDESCTDDPTLLPELEVRVARFLGSPVKLVRDADASLSAPTYVGAQLRRVRDLARDRLASAIHAALRIAQAVVRNMPDRVPDPPPADALAWRAQIPRRAAVLQLDDILGDLWTRGIPVIQATTLPSPGFQGLVAIVEGRPTVVIGHDIDEPSRLAFVVAHEVAHVVSGDCSEAQLVVDEDEGIPDDTAMEARADSFASALLTGNVRLPELSPRDFKDLATKAASQETLLGVDASSVIWAWARRTLDYQMAAMATKALYRDRGGKRIVRRHTETNVNFYDASDSDRALLRCLGR